MLELDEPEGPAVDSIAELYAREHRPMVRLATLLLGAEGPAEEVVHDAFVKVLERRATIDDLGAYLRTVVVNNCHGRTRRSSVGRNKIAKLARLQVADAAELPPEVDETWVALATVTPKQRAALVLRFYADLSIAEIAEVMGERTGTIKSVIHRGLAKLRKELS